jgi:hypothetical protein
MNMARYRYGRRQNGWDQDRLNKVFKEFRKRGLIARQNFSCCGSCAGAELANWYGARRAAGKAEQYKGLVFYHRQNTEHLRNDGITYLAYGELSHYENGEVKFKTPLSTKEVGDIIADVLKKHNMHFEWNGDPDEKILINTWKDLVEPPPPPPAYLAQGI